MELVRATNRGDLYQVKELVENGVNPNWAIAQATRLGDVEILRYLIQHGANVHFISDEDLKVAYQRGYFPLYNYVQDLKRRNRIPDYRRTYQPLSY